MNRDTGLFFFFLMEEVTHVKVTEVNKNPVIQNLN